MPLTINRFHHVALLLAISIAFVIVPMASADTIGWRTDGTGRYPDATPPTAWSDSQNVIWKTKTPARSNATPVIAGDRIFVTAEPDQLLCISTKGGDILWQKTCDIAADDPAKAEAAKVLDQQLRQLENDHRRLQRRLRRDSDNAQLKAEADAFEMQIRQVKAKFEQLGQRPQPRTHGSNGYASATPITDGKHVYALFGSGIAAAFDMNGNQKWMRFLEVPKHGWGNSASPTLSGNTLVIAINEVHGLNAATGEPKWKTGAGHGWGSPIATTIGGVDVVITPTGKIFRSDNGDELPGNLGRLTYNAPILHDGVVYFIDGEKTVAAWKLPTKLDDEPTKLWDAQLTRERYYASPLLHDGIIYAIDQKAVFTALDAATGKQIYQQKIDDLARATVYPSISLGGDMLYISSEGGTTVIAKPGRTFEQTASNDLEKFRSSPVFVGSRMYIRGSDHLYCISQNKLTSR